MFTGSQFFLFCGKLALTILQFRLFLDQNGFFFLQFFFLLSDGIFRLFDLRSAVFQRLFSVRQFLFTVRYLFSGIGKFLFSLLVNRIISSLASFLSQFFYPVLYLFYGLFIRGTVTFQFFCSIHLHIDFCINLTGKCLRKQQPKTVDAAVSDTSRSTGQIHIIGQRCRSYDRKCFLTEIIGKCRVRTALKCHLITDLFSGSIQKLLIYQNLVRFLWQPPLENLRFIHAVLQRNQLHCLFFFSLFM